MRREVTLSDGCSCEVRVLGLFSLDGVGPDIPSDYTYELVMVTGVKVDIPYPLDKLTAPPIKPDVDLDLLVPESTEWEQYREWETYAAALSQRARQIDARQQWVLNAARFISLNCLSEEDRERIIEEEDWAAVYAAALVPRVQLSDLEAALQETFGASFENNPVLDGLLSSEGGGATVDVMRHWEVKTLDKLGIWKKEDMDAWLELSVKDRAIRISGAQLSGWMRSLEIDRSIKEHKKSG